LGIFSIISSTLMPLHTPVLIILRLLDLSMPARNNKSSHALAWSV
jgi:hypothetical protein